MGTGFIDSFQLIIGIYLLYMGVKGENLENRLSGTPDKNEVKEPAALRVLYIVGAVFALSDFGICMLRNKMFTVEAAQEGNANMQYQLASYLYVGDETKEPNKEQGFRWMQAAAENGSIKAQKVLGLLYTNGQHTPWPEQDLT